MNVGIGKFLRDGLTQAGIESAFRRVVAAITAGFQIEHKEDGTHKAITATAITITEDAATDEGTGDVIADGVGTFGGNVTAQYGQTPQTEIGALSSVGHGYTDQGGIEFRSDAGRRWAWVAFSDAGIHQCNLYDLSNGSLSDDTIGIEGSGTTYYLAPGAGSTGVLGSNTVPKRKWVGYFSQAYIGTSGLPTGDWTPYTPTLTAATGTWTGATMTTAQYMVVGKTLTILFAIDAANNSLATASVSFSLPGGFTNNVLSTNPCLILDGGVRVADGVADSLASATTVRVSRIGNIGPNAANGLYVRGHIILETQ